MGASYWARWTCSEQIEDLPNLLLPHVLAEGYDLLTFDDHRQIFDRGGVVKKIAWSLNGGRWADAPVDLAISYSNIPGKTSADFHWNLSVRPLPTTQKEQASFEAWVRAQMNRITDGLQQAKPSWTDATTQPPISLPSEPPRTMPAGSSPIGPMIGIDAAVATRPARYRTTVQYASTLVEEPPYCDRCWKPAVAIPGTTGRYYCLTCHRHLPRQGALRGV